MQSYYELLGVAHDANPQIVKIAYGGKLKALAAAGLPEAERKAEERLLEQAYVTLSNPAKKSWYDKQLAGAQAEPGGGSARKGLIAAVAIVAVLIAGGAWYSLERSKVREAVRLEEQRLAIEQERLRHQLEIEKARLEDTQQGRDQGYGYRRENDQANRAERERRAEEARARAEEGRTFRDQARDRVIQTHDEREAQRREDRARAQADQDLRKARAEVERQKRFVAEREREDERIRTERYYRVQREAEANRRK
jgi:hypothetical protein